MSNYLEINKKSWNAKVQTHMESDFYFLNEFIDGKNSLPEIDIHLLGDIQGKKILHLQCHFGQDSISMSRMGAQVTGVDFSDIALKNANELAQKVGADTKFVFSDVYELPSVLDEKYDIIYTSYGTIGWLPNLDRWAGVVSHFLKPGGKLIFIDLHPFVWMYNDAFTEVSYNYFNTGPIQETYEGTYADKSADLVQEYVMWNHPTSEVINALIKACITVERFDEYNYSPWPCFSDLVEFEKGKYRLEKFGDKIPMVFSVVGKKN